MRIEILTIGGEILTGRTLDTNFRFLARALARLGIPPLWHTTVPDTRELLADALRAALERADGILMTGGLGGTPDDVTRRVLSQVLDRQLILREEVLREVEAIYRARGRTPPPVAQNMALVPQGAQLIPNPVGVAPGLLFTSAGGPWIIALPGVPEEMRAQVEQFVLPMISRQLGGTRGDEAVLRTIGLPESVLAEKLGTDHPPGLEIAYLPNWGGVDLRLVRRLDSPCSRAQFEEWVRGIRDGLGGAVFATGEEPLEKVIGDLLVRRGLTLAVAESLTGGGIGAALTRTPGSSRYFLGSVTAYSDEIKRGLLGVGRGVLLNHGAVSGPTAEAMASGVRRLFGADLAVSTTGIAGPTGSTAGKPVGLVFLGLSSTGGEAHVRRLYPGRSREGVTARAITGALWILYRHLQGLPLDDPPSAGAAPSGPRPASGSGSGHGLPESPPGSGRAGSPSERKPSGDPPGSGSGGGPRV